MQIIAYYFCECKYVLLIRTLNLYQIVLIRTYASLLTTKVKLHSKKEPVCAQSPL